MGAYQIVKIWYAFLYNHLFFGQCVECACEFAKNGCRYDEAAGLQSGVKPADNRIIVRGLVSAIFGNQALTVWMFSGFSQTAALESGAFFGTSSVEVWTGISFCFFSLLRGCPYFLKRIHMPELQSRKKWHHAAWWFLQSDLLMWQENELFYFLFL